MDNIDKLIDEVISDMQHGKVYADIILYIKIHLNDSAHFELTPVLNIKNKELLYSKIKEYIYEYTNNKILKLDPKERSLYIKRLIALLFVDMSIDDFNDPCLYVQRKINFNKNSLLDDKEFSFPSFDSSILINIEPYGKETPYCFKPSLRDGYNNYELPTISYGISDNVCYIYAIQDYNDHVKTPYHEKIKRKLYKINSGIYESESEEYKDYKEKRSNYYPENISDVSPSFIFSLVLFLNEISKKGITKIKVIPYLPIRYENKLKVLARQVLKEGERKNLNKDEKQQMYRNLVIQQKYIQSNITEKFIRCFFTVAYHFDNVKIVSFPMELDDSLNLNISLFKECNNDLLNEIISSSNIGLSK